MNNQNCPEIKFNGISILQGEFIKMRMIEAIKEIQQTKNISECEKIIVDTIIIDK